VSARPSPGQSRGTSNLGGTCRSSTRLLTAIIVRRGRGSADGCAISTKRLRAQRDRKVNFTIRPRRRELGLPPLSLCPRYSLSSSGACICALLCCLSSNRRLSPTTNNCLSHASPYFPMFSKIFTNCFLPLSHHIYKLRLRLVRPRPSRSY
jgi:hypothetical protein